jgi:hypothetical protein
MDQSAFTDGNLDELFAGKVAESREFRSWLLSRTKFAKLWPVARLLDEEQRAARNGKTWWRNWWRHLPEYEGDFATRILLVFEIEQTNLRFALHIENIPPFGGFEHNQAEAYRPRALQMMRRGRHLGYMDFETALLAPQAFILNEPRAELFDRRIPYETIAGFLPEFALADRAAA